MQDVGKWLIYCGIALAGVGAVIVLLARVGFRGLPGDIRYESDRVHVYFPIVTRIVVSILLTAISWLLQRFRNR